MLNLVKIIKKYQNKKGEKMRFLANIFGISPSGVPVEYDKLRNKVDSLKNEKERRDLVEKFEWLKRRILSLQRRGSFPDPKLGRILGEHLALCDRMINYLNSQEVKEKIKQREFGLKRNAAVAQMKRQTQIAREGGRERRQPLKQRKAIARRLRKVKGEGREVRRRFRYA